MKEKRQQKKNIEGKKNKIEKKRRVYIDKQAKKEEEKKEELQSKKALQQGKRTPGIPIKNSRNNDPKPQRTPKDKKQPINNLLGKMTMIISHAHFHRAIYRGSYKYPKLCVQRTTSHMHHH